MLFNSIDFAIFLPIVFFLYWFLANKSVRNQNLLIVVASYIFYGLWDWRFLSLILFSTFVDYTVGIKLSREKIVSKRKILLWVSIIVNIGFLGFFKYYNFFIDNFVLAFSVFGSKLEANTLNIILPVGISFYTFQTLSYTIDAYRKRLEPISDFLAFTAYVSFFPQLVAGPIERATNLIPQFMMKREFDYERAVDGLKQVLWGLFKKIVIADNCAIYVNLIFNNYQDYSGSTLVVGALFFAFQIYGDFSGYSDIAIGTSRLFGINLMRNFAFPYFSRDIAEFWRRWHISLSTWFRDYLYIPLGGSRGNILNKIRNTFIIFIVSGFWHGANWTFIVWGALNALYFLPLLISNKNRQYLDTVSKGEFLPSIKDFFKIISTFSLTVMAWVFFRAESMTQAIGYFSIIFSKSLFDMPIFQGSEDAFTTIILVVFFMVIEWVGREQEYAIAKLGVGWLRPFRWAMYYSFIIIAFSFPNTTEEFIYFQF
jgi:D-alanyl-lipoteichoic acid acyltransferase DltB (MBOAT superfamily)